MQNSDFDVKFYDKADRTKPAKVLRVIDMLGSVEMSLVRVFSSLIFRQPNI